MSINKNVYLFLMIIISLASIAEAQLISGYPQVPYQPAAPYVHYPQVPYQPAAPYAHYPQVPYQPGFPYPPNLPQEQFLAPPSAYSVHGQPVFSSGFHPVGPPPQERPDFMSHPRVQEIMRDYGHLILIDHRGISAHLDLPTNLKEEVVALYETHFNRSASPGIKQVIFRERNLPRIQRGDYGGWAFQVHEVDNFIPRSPKYSNNDPNAQYQQGRAQSSASPPVPGWERLSSIDAFNCSGQGTGYASKSKRLKTIPQYYRGKASTGLYREHGYMVKLRIIFDMGDRVEIDHCGGSVIDSTHILTAGHCVAADRSWDRIEVIVGDDNLDGANAIRRVTRKAVCHAGFRYKTLENDIAVLQIDDPFPAKIVPIEMDVEGSPSLSRGSSAVGLGWPVTGMRAGDRYLNETQFQVTDVDLRSYITVKNASSLMGGVCRGESGGPIISDGQYGKRLAGVLSGIQPGTENAHGEDCMFANYKMYYTPVAAYRIWVDNVLAQIGGGQNTRPFQNLAQTAENYQQKPPLLYTTNSPGYAGHPTQGPTEHTTGVRVYSGGPAESFTAPPIRLNANNLSNEIRTEPQSPVTHY